MRTHRLSLLLATLLPLPVLAADAPTLSPGDTAWMITATALVLFMTVPGLALFYAGLVRAKNVLSVLMQCFAITGAATLVWVLFGYSLAFTDGGANNAWIGGLSKALLGGVTKDSLSGVIPESVFLMFQMTFAIITPALIVGAFAERMRFPAMLFFSIAWLIVVYIPVCHWVWGGGFLQQAGVMDFAGGTVVHINAGVAALVAALILGRRKGFPQVAMPPHNLTMTVAGAGMLWVGWFGFNAGSALLADGSAGMAMLVTHTGAAAGCITWMVCEWLKHGKPSVLGIVTGMVAGLGTITPASGFVGPLGALAIGITAGVVCFLATAFMKQKLAVDDSLDVFPVHGVGGILGTLLTGVFAAGALGGLKGDLVIADAVLTQLKGVLVVGAYSAVGSFVLLKLTGLLTGGLRVADDQETEGLDLTQHDERGYNL
jgi:Amt family ammonium transporter